MYIKHRKFWLFSFLFLHLLICPLIYAQDVENPSALSTDELQPSHPPLSKGGLQEVKEGMVAPGDSPRKREFSEEQFKNAVNLINLKSYKEAEDILLQFTDNDLWKDKAYFLLSRIYKEQGAFDKAEDYLKRTVSSSLLLKDYALKSLTDMYISTEKFNSALEAIRQVKNKVLLKDVRNLEIIALLGAKQENKAIELLHGYIKDYPNDWKSKLTLAQLLKSHSKTDEAISLLKEIYINVVPLSADALIELRDMKADTFAPEELLVRADKLFEKGNFVRAEETYRDVLNSIEKSMRDKVLFSIGMCQFRLKQYDKSAKGFAMIETPEAMYLEALSYYRINDKEGFNNIIKKFESRYGKDEHLAKLLLILADDMRREGKLNEAEEVFKQVLNDFPSKTEDALWGLGWLNYIAREDYENASKYLLRLINESRGEDFDRYFYWYTKSLQKNCVKNKAVNNSDNPCPEKTIRPSQNTSYYSYLLKSRDQSLEKSKTRLSETEKIKTSMPTKPKGDVYDRIETLIFLGMKDEAVNEINMILQAVNKPEEFLYIGYSAMDAGEYKRIIAIADGIEKVVDSTLRDEFLPLSYPLGYWDIVKKASEDNGIDAYLVTALIREESRFDPMALSRAGAIGLMQLMPSTAQRLKGSIKIELKDNSEIYDAQKNILIGTHYLSQLIKRFKEMPLAIAAYNAGENALQKWLEQYKYKDIDEFIEDIPFEETRKYVKKVLRSYWQYRKIEGLPIVTPLEKFSNGTSRAF
ncbi:MAG: transglycosylase SLT domain-containing protein [Nitrospirae bacterium]|nr:transglycosylase SLT domain-containing protein [Nitrospirota bacterium]